MTTDREKLAREVLAETARASGQFGEINLDSDQWNPWRIAVGAMVAFADRVSPPVEVSALRAMVTELADDLEAEVQSRYPVVQRGVYPVIDRRYRRDIEMVTRARALLEGRSVEA